VDVRLPTARNSGDKPDGDQTVVQIDANGGLYVNGGIQASQQDAISKLQTVLETAKERTVYLKGDQMAPYSAIMSMMDALRKAGIDTVGLITEPTPDDKAAGK